MDEEVISEHRTERKQEITSHAVLACVAALAAGFMSALVYVAEGRFQAIDFNSEASSTLLATRRVLERNVLMLNALGGFYDASEEVSYPEFLTFTSRLLLGRKGVSALGWAPTVGSGAGDVKEFERWVGAQTKQPYTVFDIKAEGGQVATDPMSPHLPVAFMVPVKPNLPAIGLNILSRPLVALVIARARKERRAVVTGPLRLAQESTDQLGTVVYLPLYRPIWDPRHGRVIGADGFAGVLSAVFRMETLLQAALEDSGSSGLEMEIADESEGVLTPMARLEKTEFGWEPRPRDGKSLATRFSKSERLPFAGRKWILRAERDDSSATRRRILEAAAAFTVVFLGLFVSGTFRKHALLRREDEKRRADASAYNLRLQEEMDKRLEAQARSVLLASTLEGSPDAVLLSDGAGQLAFVNDAARRLFALPKAPPLPPIPIGAFHTPESRRVLEEQGFPRARESGSFTFECKVVDSRSNTIPMSSVLVATRNPSGEVNGYSLVLRDMSERVAQAAKMESLLEDATAARGQAEKASRAKDEFLQVLSHELRTPLTPILGWTSLLRGSDTGSGEVHKALGIIERSAKNQLRLINDLLEMSLLLGGSIEIRGKAINLVAALKESLDVVRPAALARNIELRVADESPVRPIVSGDAARLGQAFWNVLSNAVKFSNPGGKVTVRVSSERSMIHIAFIDEGIGIDGNFLPHVFDRFKQSDSSTTRTYLGLGLGLALVKGIVELHGGSVEAHSAGVGCGTTIVCMFPLSPFAQDDAPLPSNEEDTERASGALSEARLLVVDDVPETLATIEAAFTSRKAIVETATNAFDALQKCESSRFDLIVSDLGLPSMDGLEFIRTLRAREGMPNTDTPALALTAYASVNAYDECIGAGFQSHLAKPCDANILIRTAEDLIALSWRRTKSTTG